MSSNDDVDLASLASSPSNHSKASSPSDELSPGPSPRSSLSRFSTTSFSYNDMLFPLTTSTEDPSGHARLEKLKTVTYWSGLSLVVGLQIGSGIFSSPALVNRNAGSVGMSLIVWLFAGCLAWTGACTLSDPPISSTRLIVHSLVCRIGNSDSPEWGSICVSTSYLWAIIRFLVFMDCNYCIETWFSGHHCHYFC
jgi:hypothetical protein